MTLKLKGVSEMKCTTFICLLLLSLFLCTSPASATQTCRSDLAPSTPDGRYTKNSDGTVTDTVTNLTWKRCSEGLSGPSCETGKAVTFTWSDAIKSAASSTFAGKNDWRVPTVQELDTIIEYRCTMPSVNAIIFPATATSNFWTVSPFAGYPDGSWNINFNDGAHETCNRNWNLYLRLVRGTMLNQEGACR